MPVLYIGSTVPEG